MEEWRPVVGFEGLYEVSDLGRVRSLDRVDTLGRLRPGRSMAGSPDGQGYLNYGLTPKDPSGKAQRQQTIRGHVLVLTAFEGPCPDGHEGCHGNDVPDDNRRVNLRWAPRPANRADAIRNRSGLTSKRRPRKRRERLEGHCNRGRRLAAPNLTAPQASHPEGRCRACRSGHNAVNDARRHHGLTLDVKTEADRRYARIMADSPATL